MPAVTLGQSDPSGTRSHAWADAWTALARPAARIALARPAARIALARPAARVLAFWLALWSLGGSAGCDSNQYVIVSLQGLPTSGTVTVRATYALDSGPKMALARLPAPANQFIITFAGDARGMLLTTFRADTYVAPGECSRSEIMATLKLSGDHKQALVATLPTAARVDCDATQVPVTLPTTAAAPLAIWGSGPDDIWVVGEKGMILHWQNKTFTQITLPQDLVAAPPTWRAVSGVPGYPTVWVAGDRGVIARIDAMQLTAVRLVDTNGMALTLGGDALPSWVGLSIANLTTKDVFFASSNGYIGHHLDTKNGVEVDLAIRTYPIYPNGSPLGAMSSTVSFSDVFCLYFYECWFVGYDPNALPSGDQKGAGYILQAYSLNNDGMYAYSDYSMNAVTTAEPVTRNRLRGVWAPLGAPPGLARQLYIVGENATVLFSNTSLFGSAGGTTYYPRFQTDYSTVVTASLQGKTQKLNALRGTSPSDLWIVGDAGVLLRWDPMPALPGNPFTVVNTGVTANLTSVFSTGAGGRVYVAGEQQTFISP